MIDMSGWASLDAAAARAQMDVWGMGDDLPTLDDLLEARNEGRRNRAHYSREIRRMRELTPEEWSARVR